jgi:hypothetical protein
MSFSTCKHIAGDLIKEIDKFSRERMSSYNEEKKILEFDPEKFQIEIEGWEYAVIRAGCVEVESGGGFPFVRVCDSNFVLGKEASTNGKTLLHRPSRTCRSSR